MTNNLLYSRIVLLYGSATAFAKALGTTKSFVSQKLNGRLKWTKRDLEKWGPLLQLDEQGLRKYFPEYFEDVERRLVF